MENIKDDFKCDIKDEKNLINNFGKHFKEDVKPKEYIVKNYEELIINSYECKKNSQLEWLGVEKPEN